VVLPIFDATGGAGVAELDHLPPRHSLANVGGDGVDVPLVRRVVAALAVGLDARRERVAQREVVPGRRTWRDAAARRGIPLRGAGGQRSEVDGYERGGQEADPRASPH